MARRKNTKKKRTKGRKYKGGNPSESILGKRTQERYYLRPSEKSNYINYVAKNPEEFIQTSNAYLSTESRNVSEIHPPKKRKSGIDGTKKIATRINYVTPAYNELFNHI
jgi:hypothetical protein